MHVQSCAPPMFSQTPVKAEATTWLSHAEFRHALLQIRTGLKVMEEAEPAIAAGDGLWCFRVASLHAAVERLNAFATEVQRSALAAQSGKPFDQNTTKGRKK